VSATPLICSQKQLLKGVEVVVKKVGRDPLRLSLEGKDERVKNLRVGPLV
jgi:hypothetical protein